MEKAFHAFSRAAGRIETHYPNVVNSNAALVFYERRDDFELGSRRLLAGLSGRQRRATAAGQCWDSVTDVSHCGASIQLMLGTVRLNPKL